MAPMANALPQVQYRHGQYPVAHQQRYSHPTSPHMAPYGHSPGGMNMNMNHHGYYVQQQPQMVPYYAGNQPQSQMQMPPRQNVAYYPHQMMMGQPQGQPQGGYYYPQQQAQYPNPNQSMPQAPAPRQFQHQNSHANNPNVVADTSSQPAIKPQHVAGPRVIDGLNRPTHGQDTTGKRQGAVRGPPRKPKQSGHAIWIGNLPPQTDLMTLVAHVCREVGELESLFLISKSNCAFANFKDEEVCSRAQLKIHDSQFQAAKLVSRLRRNNTSESAAAPTSPTRSSSAGTSLSPDGTDGTSDTSPPETDGSTPPTAVQSPQTQPTIARDPAQQDRFFILKSLTVEDLELSVTTGLWATQSHNEKTLNNAFQIVENVYLVFSANKSGEYFGYARMLSQIDEDPAAAIQFAPKTQTTSDLDLPKVITTEATEHVPTGRIIDDSARGTIFWEVYREDLENESDDNSEAGSTRSAGGEDDEPKTWGKPFKLEWLSTTRLPFYRTRGLRNPWNSHREVKIARDGTELEPSVGRKLIGLFNRPPAQPQPFNPLGRPPSGMPPGYPA